MSDDVMEKVSDASERAGFETSDVSPRRVTLLLGVIVLSLIVTLVVCVMIVWALKPEKIALQGGANQIYGDNPRLLVKPREERLKVEAAAKRRIEAYAATAEEGYARIPIERAMALLAANGWPDRKMAQEQQKEGGQ